jgi:hypothetical protein
MSNRGRSRGGHRPQRGRGGNSHSSYKPQAHSHSHYKAMGQKPKGKISLQTAVLCGDLGRLALFSSDETDVVQKQLQSRKWSHSQLLEPLDALSTTLLHVAAQHSKQNPAILSCVVHHT